MVSRNERELILLLLFFLTVSVSRERKQRAATKITKILHAWYIKIDVSYATSYILRNDGYKI